MPPRRPHVTPVVAAWAEGAIWFSTRADSVTPAKVFAHAKGGLFGTITHRFPPA